MAKSKSNTWVQAFNWAVKRTGKPKRAPKLVIRPTKPTKTATPFWTCN